MRLVDEIEAAAKDHGGMAVLFGRWQQIKAALLAGEELVNGSDHDGTVATCWECNAVARFRAATEGTK